MAVEPKQRGERPRKATALVDTETGEIQEKRLAHREEAEAFYRALAARRCGSGWKPAGMAAGLNDSWPSCSGRVAVELLIGDVADIRTRRVRKQK
jgi:hypothetical protein